MDGDPKADRRDAKLRKRRGLSMIIDNRSLKSVILPLIGRKASAGKKGDKNVRDQAARPGRARGA